MRDAQRSWTGTRAAAVTFYQATATKETNAEDPEDRGRVARRADAGAVQRAPREGHGASVQRRVRPRLRAGHLPVRGLRSGAVRLGHEVRLGLRLARVLRAGRR